MTFTSGSVKAKNIIRQAVLMFVAAVILIAGVVNTTTVYSDAITHKEIENLTFERYDKERFVIKTIHYSYGNNRYVSVRDMAAALSGTPKHFDVYFSSDKTSIFTDSDYEPAGPENEEFADEEYSTDPIRPNPVEIDGRECRYYTFIGKDSEGKRDLYMSITDLAMALNADLYMDTEASILRMGEGDFRIDIDEYVAQGLYDEVSGALVGNAFTGEIYTSFHEDVSVPCASTTKLMTYLCIMDAVSAGEISLDDTVVISEKAAALSRTSDGVIRMNAGQSAKLYDMLYALLLPSSNEAALALAEHLDGTEEAFTLRMNKKVKELNLSDATYFYNPHGLPEYSDTVAASKVQNHISAYDMFVLSSHILNKYPEIKDITSTKKYKLEAFSTEVENTNPLLYNMPGIVGLKTGTTKASGASLVSAYDFLEGTKKCTIVAVEYGAEDAASRNTVSEILIRYGIQCAENGTGTDVEGEEAFPYTADGIIRRLIFIKSMKRQG